MPRGGRFPTSAGRRGGGGGIGAGAGGRGRARRTRRRVRLLAQTLEDVEVRCAASLLVARHVAHLPIPPSVDDIIRAVTGSRERLSHVLCDLPSRSRPSHDILDLLEVPIDFFCRTVALVRGFSERLQHDAIELRSGTRGCKTLGGSTGLGPLQLLESRVSRCPRKAAGGPASTLPHAECRAKSRRSAGRITPPRACSRLMYPNLPLMTLRLGAAQPARGLVAIPKSMSFTSPSNRDDDILRCGRARCTFDGHGRAVHVLALARVRRPGPSPRCEKNT